MQSSSVCLRVTALLLALTIVVCCPHPSSSAGLPLRQGWLAESQDGNDIWFGAKEKNGLRLRVGRLIQSDAEWRYF